VKIALYILLAVAITSTVFGQDSSGSKEDQAWNFHFQQTVIWQYHFDFPAPYSGVNSLKPVESPQISVTSTLFIGRGLWQGGELYFNPELSGGNGLSGSSGVAGFLNGETYRIGDPQPEVTVARIFLRQNFALSGDATPAADQENQLAVRQAPSRVVLTLGKFGVTDVFDNNAYSHDPRTQFFNWALMTYGAWDYPANTRGYTWGFIAELIHPEWAIRISGAMVPTEANQSEMDSKIDSARSGTLELEKSFTLGSQKGVVRLLGYYTQARMGNYREALLAPQGAADIATTRRYGRTKSGAGLSIEEALSDDAGIMVRASWNDGQNETWMFTEIDQSLSAGLLLDGRPWHRTDDNAGFAFALNGISPDHRDYLSAGGHGFIIGDGKLNYEPELILESFYSLALPQWNLRLTPDYQFVLHPAYNQDRGPVHAVALRGHIAF
jgi:high affinity Mn2+ porin